MARYNVYLHGWNTANNPSMAGGWEDVLLATVEAESESAACERYAGQAYNNQYVWAEDADEAESRLAVTQERIDRFFAPRAGKRLYVEGNGGPADVDVRGGYSYEGDDLSVPEAGLQELWSFAADGESVTVETSPGTWTRYSWLDDPWRGAKIVACYGSHYGFAWGPSADDLGDDWSLDLGDRTDCLEAAICACTAGGWDAAALGLDYLDDPTDDGINFAVANEPLFRRVVAECNTAQAAWDALDPGDSGEEPEDAGKRIAEEFAAAIAD